MTYTRPRPLQESDDRAAFDCGRSSLNSWFAQRAWKNQVTGVSRTSVVCDEATGVVAGFVVLSAAQIERGQMPKGHQRNIPDPIPAIRLGQLAVDRRHQGCGLATSLLIHAFRTALQASRSIGCYAILTHPLDETVRSFYGRFGFADLPFDPLRAMVVRMIDLERNGF